MIAIGSTVLPLNFVLAGGLNPIDGKPLGIGSVVTVTYPYGANTVLSVQPDGAGTYQTRPQGTQGAYETFTVTAQGLFICPDGKTPYLVPFVNPGATS